MKKAYLSLIAVAVMVAFAPLLARADVLSPSGVTGASPTVFTTPVGMPSGVVADTGIVDWSWVNPSDSSVHLEGNYREIVFSDPNNVWCSGCMTFLIGVVSYGTSTDVIERITTGLFGSFLADVGYDTGWQTGFVDVIPDTVDRSVGGNTIGFNYLNGITAGGGSSDLIIETNAHSYQAGTIAVIDSQSINLSGYAPSVPEPETAAMLGLGLLVLGAGFMFKRRAASLV